MNYISVRNRPFTKKELLCIAGYGETILEHIASAEHSKFEKDLAKEVIFYREWVEKLYELRSAPKDELSDAFCNLRSGINAYEC